MPPCILSRPTTIRRARVAACFGEVTQQIHSFRASGVSSRQSLATLALDSMADRKSSGNAWTVPPGSWGLDMTPSVDSDRFF